MMQKLNDLCKLFNASFNSLIIAILSNKKGASFTLIQQKQPDQATDFRVLKCPCVPVLAAPQQAEPS